MRPGWTRALVPCGLPDLSDLARAATPGRPTAPRPASGVTGLGGCAACRTGLAVLAWPGAGARARGAFGAARTRPPAPCCTPTHRRPTAPRPVFDGTGWAGRTAGRAGVADWAWPSASASAVWPALPPPPSPCCARVRCHSPSLRDRRKPRRLRALAAATNQAGALHHFALWSISLQRQQRMD